MAIKPVRPTDVRIPVSRVYGRAAVGAVLPANHQSLYARIAAQRAAFLQSQPQTLYDPGLNPVVSNRIRNQYGFDDSEWKAITQTIGGVVGAGVGISKGSAVGASVGAGLASLLGQLGPQAAVPEELVTIPIFTKIGSVIGGAIGGITGAQTGAAVGGLFSPSGLIATGELLRNTVINVSKEPVTGLATAGITFGGQYLVGRYLPGLDGISRIAVANALTRVGIQGYIGFSNMLAEDDQTISPSGAMSALSAVANTMDNYSGATTIKAGLAAATGDEEDFMTILSKAYGWNEEGFTQLDFTRIRENTGLDIGTFGNAAIDFAGEMLVDPGIWYSQMRGSAEMHIHQRTRSVLAAEQINSINVRGAEIDLPSNTWGRFVQALDRSGFYRMSRVINEYIFEQSKHGRIVSKIAKKTPNKAYTMFKDEMIKSAMHNPNIAKLLSEGKNLDDVLKPLYNEMVQKVMDTTDNSILNKALLEQQSVDEVKNMYDLIMKDPSIKKKGEAIDMNIYADLKKYKTKISMNDFNRIKDNYPTIRAMDEIDNFLGMTTMSLFNPAMAGARFGSYKMKMFLSKGRADRSFKTDSILEINKDGKIIKSNNYKVAMDKLKAERQILVENKKRIVDEIKQRNKELKVEELNKTAAMYDEQISKLEDEFKQLDQEFKEKKALYTAILWDKSGLSAEYGMYDQDSIKLMEDKLKGMDSKDPGYEELKETIASFKETKILLDTHSLEIDILKDVLKEMKQLELLYKMYGDEFDIQYTSGKNNKLKVTRNGETVELSPNQTGYNYQREKQRAMLNNKAFVDQVRFVDSRIMQLLEILKQAGTDIDSDIKQRLYHQLTSNFIFNTYAGNGLKIRQLEFELKDMRVNDKGYIDIARQIEELKGQDPLRFLRKRAGFSNDEIKQFSETDPVQKGDGSYIGLKVKEFDNTTVFTKARSAIEQKQFKHMMDALGISGDSPLYKILQDAVFSTGGETTISYRDVKTKEVLSKYFDNEDSALSLFDYDTFNTAYHRLIKYEELLKTNDKYAKPLEHIRLSDSDDLSSYDMTYAEFKNMLNEMMEDLPTKLTPEEFTSRMNKHVREYYVRSKVYILEPSKDLTRTAKEMSLIDWIMEPNNFNKLSYEDKELIKQISDDLYKVEERNEIVTLKKSSLRDLVRIKDHLKQERPMIQVNKNKIIMDMIYTNQYNDIYLSAVRLFNALSGKGNVTDYTNTGYEYLFGKAAGGAFDGNHSVNMLKQDLSNFTKSVEVVRRIQDKFKHSKAAYEGLDILKSKLLDLKDILSVNPEGDYKYSAEQTLKILEEKRAVLLNSKAKYNPEIVDSVIDMIKYLRNSEHYKGFEYKDFNKNLIDDAIRVIKDVHDIVEAEEAGVSQVNMIKDSQEIKKATGSDELQFTKGQVTQSLRELLSQLKSDGRAAIGKTKRINNVLDRVVLDTDVSRRMQEQGIDYSVIGKEGYILTLKTPLTMRNDSKFKSLYGDAWFTKRVDKYEPEDPEAYREQKVYGIDESNRSKGLDSVIKGYENAFPKHSDADFILMSHVMKRAKQYGLKGHELRLGRYYYETRVKHDMDEGLIDFYAIVKTYNANISFNDLKAVIGLTRFYAENQLATMDRLGVEIDFEKFETKAKEELEELGNQVNKYKYSEELKAADTLMNNVPMQVIRERAEQLGIKLTKGLMDRIEKYRDPNSNAESEHILKEDILKRIIKAKNPDAYEVKTVEESLSGQVYALRMNGPQDGNVNINLGNTKVIYKKTGIPATTFPNHNKILVFDEETTGLKVDEDKATVLEHGSELLENIDGEFVAVRQLTMLNKLKNLTKESTSITGITRADLKKHGINEKQLAEEIYSVIKDEDVLLVAYNAGFDLGFVNKLLRRHIPDFKGINNDILDPMTMYQDKYGYSSKLEVASARTDAIGENTHRATDDASLTTSVLQRLISGGQDPTPYINRLGYIKKYESEINKIKGVSYVAQDQYDPATRNQFSNKKPRVKSKAVQFSKSKQDYLLEVEKLANDYIKEHGQEKIEVPKDHYEKAQLLKEIDELRKAKKEALDAIQEKYSADRLNEEIGYYKENERIKVVHDELIKTMVSRDQVGFKKLISDFIKGLDGDAPVDKIADNLWTLYEDMVISKEAIDGLLEPYLSNKVVYYDPNEGRYKTIYTNNPEDYADSAYKKPYSEMNETELQYYRENITKKYMSQMLKEQLRLYEDKGEWIPAQDEYLKMFDDRIKGIDNEMKEIYDRDVMKTTINRIDQFYNMKLDQLKMYFTDKYGKVNYGEFFRFIEDNPDLKIVVSYMSNEARVKQVVDPETLVAISPTDNPTVKEAIISNADELQALSEMGKGLQVGIMTVEQFKTARNFTNNPYKLPKGLDFYYRNIERLQKKDMLLRFSFHPRNLIDVIRKNSRILSNVWQTPDFIQQGAKAFNLYHKWNSYQKGIVEHMNELHAMYARGATPEEISNVKNTLIDRENYLRNEITNSSGNKYQLKRDMDQLKEIVRLKENFDKLSPADAIKELYKHYDHIGFGAYIRQHHYKHYTVEDYLNNRVELDSKDIDTHVYLKLKKTKKFKQATLEVQEQLLKEAVEDEITLLDMTNIFERTSATTDINAFMKRLNKKAIEGERLPLGDRVFQTLATDNWFSKKYMGIGTEIEQVGRLHGYLLDRYLYGRNHDEAVTNSLKRHYDYSDQSPAEVWATLIFPFHAFPTRNAMFWSGIFQDASQIRTMHNLITALWGSVDEEDKDSDYIQNAMINGYVPVGNTLIKLGDSRASAFGLFLNPQNEVSGRLNPLIREPINQLAGKGNKGLDILRNVPIARFIPEIKTASQKLRQGGSIHKSIAPSVFGTMFRQDNQPYYDKYKNIYRNLYTVKGKMRTPSTDAYYRVRSIMYDIQKRRYS